ncbi:MAG: hypothetical protein SGI89_13370 [bacterium]|nr:hypothetical protein [bacterium]
MSPISPAVISVKIPLPSFLLSEEVESFVAVRKQSILPSLS